MPAIEEILKLPKEKQLAIMEAIQEHLEIEFWEDEPISDAHIVFINNRIQQINSAPQKTFTWNEVKEKLANRWNTL